MFIIWRSLSFSRRFGLPMGVDGPMKSSQQFGVSPYPELDQFNLPILLRTVKFSPQIPFYVFLNVIKKHAVLYLGRKTSICAVQHRYILALNHNRTHDSRVRMEEAVHNFQSGGNTTYSPHVVFILVENTL
jgi:hypothetical protein